jgi:hypothetical protein
VDLRHQLAILRRGGKGRSRRPPIEPYLQWPAASSRTSAAPWFAVDPETLCRWHRTLLERGRRGPEGCQNPSSAWILSFDTLHDPTGAAECRR